MLLVTSIKFTFAIIVGRTMWYDDLCFRTWNRLVLLNEDGCASFDRFVSPALIVLTNDVLVSIRERVHENMARLKFFHVQPVRLWFTFTKVFPVDVPVLF